MEIGIKYCVFILVILFACSIAFAKNLECTTFVYNNKSDEMTQGRLTQAAYDENFLEGSIKSYQFGADKFFLKDNDSLTLIVVETKSHASATATAGFRTIEKTRMIEANLFFNLPDGSMDQAQVSCYDYL